jgi:hypothetical protein
MKLTDKIDEELVENYHKNYRGVDATFNWWNDGPTFNGEYVTTLGDLIEKIYEYGRENGKQSIKREIRDIFGTK